jgi:cytochrome P450
VFEDPEAFIPARFSPERKAALPKGAYVPFGAGSRTCIGMRFGQLEIKTVATLVLQRFRPAVPAAHSLHVRQMPTLSPEGGLPMALREREAL